MKAFLSVLLVLGLSWPVYGADLPSEKIQAEAENTTPELSADSRRHSRGVIERYGVLQNFTNPPTGEISLAYNPEGYPEEVGFADGSALILRYELNTLSGDIQSVQITDKTNVLKIESKEPVKEGTGVQTPVVTTPPHIPLKGLMDTLKKGEPAFALSGQLDTQSFQEFLSRLKKPVVGDKLRQTPVDFVALKENFMTLKSGQDKAFQKYAARTDSYYRVIGEALAEKTNGKALSREEIDAWAARKSGSGDAAIAALRGPSQTGLPALERALYKSIVLPGRKELKDDLEISAAEFDAKLKELLSSRKTSLRRGAGITEIVLILPQKQD